VKRFLSLSALAVAVLALGGCGARGRQEQGEWLARWVSEQAYSTWSTFRSRDHTPHQPASPDGLTLGSPQVFAAIGCNDKDLAALDVLWADEGLVRVLAKPLRVGVRSGGTAVQFVNEFPEQRLRRVRHTSIAVSDSEGDDLRVTSVDFAPMGKEDSFLVRWFLVENTGKTTRNLSLAFDVGAPGEWVRRNARAWQLGDKLALVSDVELAQDGDLVEGRLGRVRPGAKAAMALVIVGARDSVRLSRYTARVEESVSRLPQLLEETKTDWQDWCARTPLRTGNERTDDLLDSLLCLVRSHIGEKAIHTGSVYYAHNRAWVRDNYWVQRTLLELGLVEEARVSLDFFHRAWRKSGVCSYYEIADERGASYGYGRVELPHYLVLMVRDAEELGRVDGRQYWDMVQGCLDHAAVPGDGLQPMNGDETWLLAAPVRELDSLLDNSWLLIASADYGSRLAQKMGDRDRAARYGAMAYRARLALREFMPAPYQPHWYAIGRGGDGSLDFSLCPEVYARGALLGVLPSDDEFLVDGLVTSWERLSFERGIRTHARSATISGGTPGYVLYAAADSRICSSLVNRELLERVQGFASATGCVWEYHDLYDPAWGGEKRRLWDSAVLLMGLTHALFEIKYEAGTVSFVPKGPAPVVEYERSGFPPMNRGTAEKLVDITGRPLILQEGSPEHAARIARELTRQRNQEFRTDAFTGQAPEDQPAIIISTAPAPSDWPQQHLSYWQREWEGPPQVWVMNTGDVFKDTEPLLRDLLCTLPPLREKPMRYPEANLDLVARLGEAPEGEAELAAKCGDTVSITSVALDTATATLKPQGAEVTVATAWEREERMVKLAVSAGPRPQPTELTVTLPADWWLIRARDMTGQWDRVEDPVREFDLPDGRTRLAYSFRAGTEPVSTTFELARLRVGR
jgi:hypothetical protein